MKMTPSMAKKVREACQASLHFLCTQFLGYKDWDEIHTDIEKLLRRPSKKKAILVPRNHLKSSIVTIGYTIQQILINPNIRVLIANGVWDMARKFLDEIKGHLQMGQLKYLFGDFMSAKWNADEIIVQQRVKSLKEPTIMTTGTEAEQTGGHFDLILLDDLTGLQNSQTPEQRQKTKRFRRSMINLLEPGGQLIEVMTRWHSDDTFSDIEEKERRYYDIMVRKVVEDGKLIFPKKFAKKFDEKRKDWVAVEDPRCLDYIQHLKESMPVDEFASQYENNPISMEDAVFKPEMFRYWRERPERLFVVLSIDLAISQAYYADWTALVTVGMDEKRNIYVLDYLRGRWVPSVTVENIFAMQEKWKPVMMGMETLGFQQTYKLALEAEMRKRNNYFPIQEVKVGTTKSKEYRIKRLEPFYRNGSVFHAAWMKERELENELLRFPKAQHDDICDALAAGLNFLVPGDAEPVQQAPPGSFQAVATEAQRNRIMTSGFFNMLW